MAITVRDIQQQLAQLAPVALAESWDNVGLLIGDPGQAVTNVLVALDATAEVLAQAEEMGAELLVVHHPLIFSGVKRLVEDGGTVSLVRRLVRGERSLIAMHTNLDSSPEGLNHYVAGLLGIRNLRPLLPSAARLLLKLVVYVPVTHADSLREAICHAGAGQIGHYSECTFSTSGTGTFRPEEGTSPYIGSTGELERVPEVRLETIVPRPALHRVLQAMLTHHPYEEVAYDLFPMENAWPGAGLGRIGALDTSLTLAEFTQTVRTALGTERLGIIGDPARSIRTVALCTGSGGEFLDAALGAGADCYLTGEVKHHQALLARQLGIACIDAGHFPTERPAASLLADYLATYCPDVAVHRAAERDPFSTV